MYSAVDKLLSSVHYNRSFWVTSNKNYSKCECTVDFYERVVDVFHQHATLFRLEGENNDFRVIVNILFKNIISGKYICKKSPAKRACFECGDGFICDFLENFDTNFVKTQAIVKIHLSILLCDTLKQVRPCKNCGKML